MQKRLISLLTEVKPRRALLSTYAFSIAWFDGFALPALRAAGCGQIDLLVDAREACKMTDEAASLYAGSAYRIIPVYMPGTTVFHPKVAYLECESRDCLVVSSANLTLSGHGRNLEVLDAVDTDSSPHVFGEFAEFLGSLLEKHDFSVHNQEVLGSYQERAATWMKGAGDSEGRRTWLVHTLITPAIEQLTTLSHHVGTARSLTVLSPFHSPSGAPIRSLASKIGVGTVRIGLGPKRQIPFDKDALELNPEPQYVLPDTGDVARPLHAKCFEIVGDAGVLAMTGSVNATSQSLETTKNVEIALVRRLATSPFEWVDEPEPAGYCAGEFFAHELTARNPAVQATWTLEGRIEGQIFPAAAAQIGKLELWDDEVELFMGNISVADDGSFSIAMRQMFDARGAMRLVVKTDDYAAAGWVNVELDLAVEESERSVAKASTRILAGAPRLDDIETIMTWLTSVRLSGTPMEIRSGSGPGNAHLQAEASPQKSITYDNWRTTGKQRHQFGMPLDVAARTLEETLSFLEHSMATTQAGIHRPDAQFSAPGNAGDGVPSAPDRAAPVSASTPAETGAAQLPLLKTKESEFQDPTGPVQLGRSNTNIDYGAIRRQMLACLPRAVEFDPRSPLAPVLVELSGAATLKDCLGTAATDLLGSSFPDTMATWFSRFSRIAYADDARARLLPFFWALACVTAHYRPNVSLPALKESLLRVAPTTLTDREISLFALQGLVRPQFSYIDHGLHATIAARAVEINTAMTLMEQLETLVEHTVLHTVPATVPRDLRDAFLALHQHRKSPHKAFGLIQDRIDAGQACPCCHARIDPDDRRRLRATRAIVCRTCTRALFFGLDRRTLESRGLGGRFME